MQAALADHAAGRLAAARSGYQTILSTHPHHARALHSLGVLEKTLGNPVVAVDLISRAIALQPAAEIYNNLGDALLMLERTDDAVAALERSIQLSPRYFKAFNNLGLARLRQGRIGDAAAALTQAIALKPDYSRAMANLAGVFTQSLRHDEALACYRRALQIDPNYSTAHSSMLMLLNYMDLDAQEIFHAHQKWAHKHAEPVSAAAAKPTAVRGGAGADRPLRIGYVSGDFSAHAVADFFLPVLKFRDRDRVHATCYSTLARVDAMTLQIQQAADAWRDISSLSDDDAAAIVRRDEIDVLVELAGHTAKNRLLLFARKPAPVQVTWLGYPNTTGMSAINYRITDALADPPGATESLHTENLVRLRSTWCYPPPASAGEVVPPPASMRADGMVTFGSFNNPAKLTPRWLKLWSQILDAVPNGRLVIKSNATGDADVQSRIRSHLADPDRVQFLGREQDYRRHFERYGEVDLMLDPFPYHGTTMTCEALWMGVPVVTMAGRTHVSRVGVSLLSSVGLTELIAQTPEEYVAIAKGLARDVPRLVELRRTMRQRMLTSPLLDGAGFVRELESAYRKMLEAKLK